MREPLSVILKLQNGIMELSILTMTSMRSLPRNLLKVIERSSKKRNREEVESERERESLHKIDHFRRAFFMKTFAFSLQKK